MLVYDIIVLLQYYYYYYILTIIIYYYFYHILVGFFMSKEEIRLGINDEISSLFKKEQIKDIIDERLNWIEENSRYMSLRQCQRMIKIAQSRAENIQEWMKKNKLIE